MTLLKREKEKSELGRTENKNEKEPKKPRLNRKGKESSPESITKS